VEKENPASKKENLTGKQSKRHSVVLFLLVVRSGKTSIILPATSLGQQQLKEQERKQGLGNYRMIGTGWRKS